MHLLVWSLKQRSTDTVGVRCAGAVWGRGFMRGESMGGAGDVGEAVRWDGVCVLGGGWLHGYFLYSLPEWTLLTARSSGSLCVCVFFSQVDHGECSQVSVRCQVATCLCVFKAAVAWIVFTAQRAQQRGERWGREHWLWSVVDCLIACVGVKEWVSEREVREKIWVHAHLFSGVHKYLHTC